MPIMPLALLALTISAFAIGTTEFVIVGLIPTIASDLNVSLPSAGLHRLIGHRFRRSGDRHDHRGTDQRLLEYFICDFLFHLYPNLLKVQRRL